MTSKKKLIISMLVVSFVLLSIIATVAIAFALTQQTIKTSLNIGYTVQDIDGSVSATFTIGGVEENLTAVKAGGDVIGDRLIFRATDTQDAGSFMFPEDALALTSTDDNVIIKYTYKNTGDKHYIATMSFDAELTYENMNVEYGIWDFNTNEIKYSNKRYALVVPSDKELSYWIRISVADKSKSASFVGDFDWFLEGSDKDSLGYELVQAFEFTGNDGVYSAAFNGDTALLEDGALIIPTEVSGYPVTSITANTSLTQAQKEAVTSVVIPESISTIGDSAFEGYTNLATVTLEQTQSAGAVSAQSESTGLTTIGANSFKDCSSLTELTIPSSISTFDTTALTGCVDLKNITLDTMLANARTAVKNLADTNGEMHLIIGDSVTNIPANAFSNWKALTTFTMGINVIKVGNWAFTSCSNLSTIITRDINKWASIDFDVSYSNPLTCTNNFYLNTDLENPITSITLSDDVTKIGNYAFDGFKTLTSINFPASITNTSYFYYSFRLCGLTNINVSSAHPDLYSVNNCVINKNTKTLILGCQTSVIPTDGSVTKIANYAFISCKGLTSLLIPNTITSIGQSTFESSGLTSLEIPDSVKTISYYAFQNCKSLTSVKLGNGLTVIEKATFWACNSITSLTLGENITTINESGFDGCSGLTSIILPQSLKTIGKRAFEYCRGLTSVTIVGSVTRINARAFNGCSGLTSVTFENPRGWSLTNGTTLSEADLSNTSTAAKYLRTTYSSDSHIWTRA